ncbi:hypothetical protein VTO73DRAFT_3870 [Trametes versicolor]
MNFSQDAAPSAVQRARAVNHRDHTGRVVRGPSASQQIGVDEVIRTDAPYFGPPSDPTLVLPLGMTSSRFLLELVNSRVYIVALPHDPSSRAPYMVISSRELRALLMKALIWFVDRECLADVGDSRVVLVGHDHDQVMEPVCPSLTVYKLRAIAEELSDDLKTPRAADDFDAFMFHAHQYSEGRSYGLGVMAVVVIVLALICPAFY